MRILAVHTSADSDLEPRNKMAKMKDVEENSLCKDGDDRTVVNLMY